MMGSGHRLALVGIVALIISLAGCAGADRFSYRNVVEQRVPGHVTAEYDLFDGVRYNTARVQNGQMFVLEYDVMVNSGRLMLSVRNPLRMRVWRQEFVGGNHHERIELPARPAGLYVIEIRGEGTRGSYDLRWAAMSAQGVRYVRSSRGARP